MLKFLIENKLIFIVFGFFVFIGIVASLLYGLYLERIKRLRNFNNFLNFILTLLAVFIGAYLGFAFSNFQEEEKEKDILIAQLSSTFSELSIESTTESLYYDEMIKKGNTLAELALNNNPLPEIFSINVLLEIQYLPKYITPFSLVYLKGMYGEKEKFRLDINDSNENVQKRLKALVIYKDYINALANCVKIQLDYLQGNISLEEVHNRENKLYHVQKNQGIGWE